MVYKHLSIIVILLFTAAYSINGQFYVSEQEPASINWRQIETANFKLVYDSGFEQQAQRVAAILDYGSQLKGNTLNQKAEKIPILIHSNSIVSNGMVVWAPKRMELYTVAPQDIYAQGWFEQLALHEGRHVAQCNKLIRFPTNVLTSAFGEGGMLINFAQTPTWLMEGDAVSTETALSQSGRGRLPSFEMGYRAFLLENHKPFGFRKAVFGSYHDYVPNHYELGYLVVAYNRAIYGAKLWENTLIDIGERPYGFTPFLSSIKRQTGINRETLYFQTMAALDSLWTLKSQGIKYSLFNKINQQRKKTFTSYRSACVYKNFIIAIKSGIDDITRIVAIDTTNGQEKVLFTPGSILSDRITLGGNILSWDEPISDPRWGQRSYSVIRYFNLQNGKNGYLTWKTRFFAPAISPNGNILAVVEPDTKGINSLVLLNADNGSLISKTEVPENAVIQHPSWDSTSRYLAMTMVNENGKGIVVFDTQNNSWETLIEPGHFNLSQPVFYRNLVFFNASYSGVDNIYAINRVSKLIFQVTSSKYGAFDFNFIPNTALLVYSDYTSHGFDLVSSTMDSSKWISLINVKNIALDIPEKIAAQEPQKFNSTQVQYKQYESKPFCKFTHLFNIHTWVPFYFNNNPLNIFYNIPKFGYQLFSQNLHGTLIASGGQGFYKDKLLSSLSFTYQGFYPVIETSVNHGNSVYSIYKPDLKYKKGKSLLFDTKVSIPLNFSYGDKQIGLIPWVQYAYENMYYHTSENDSLQGISKYVLGARFSCFQKYTVKDIVPRYGFSFIGMYLQPISDISKFATQTVALLSLYLPGFLPHHAIKISLSYENQVTNIYRESNRLASPRGFIYDWALKPRNYKEMGIYSADYIFPIAYPDLTITKVFYIKRLNGALFYENSQMNEFKKPHSFPSNYISTGIELTADFNAFFIPPAVFPYFRIGFRQSYLPQLRNWSTEFIFRSSMFNL